MMTGQICCGACRFWRASDFPLDTSGECRRYPPRRKETRPYVNDPSIKIIPIWPETDRIDWCGEFLEAEK